MMNDVNEQAVQETAARDATHWAKAVSRLEVSEVPEGAAGINVAGKRLAGPVQGFGKMWQKTYQVAFPRDMVHATELIATWKQRFPEFWPEGNRFYAPLTGIEPGEVALIVGLLAKARAHAIPIRAYGLTPHYQEIFEITRLADFLAINPDEDSAVRGAEGNH